MAGHFGRAYPAIDPLSFLVDDEIRPFFLDERHDLTATAATVAQAAQAAPIKSTGVFIVHRHIVPDGEGEVILGVAPHCWARTDPGGANESIALLTREQLAGWVLFTQSKTSNQPYTVQVDYNTPTVSAAGGGTPNDKSRQTLSGTTFIPTDVQQFSQVGFVNPLQAIYLPGKAVFEVYFQLLPQLTVAAGGPPVVMQIGAGADGKRLDFAGASVFGVRMPQTRYDDLLNARRRGLLGPEAARPMDPSKF